MTYLFRIMILALFLSGCSALEQKLSRPLVIPPDTICEKNESLLICDSAKLESCVGYYKEDKRITLEETEL